MLITGHMLARGEGSTLRHKNVREINGKPMVYWALKHALEAGFMDQVFVFTEDERIAAVAAELGCRAIERPREMLFYHGGFSKHYEWGQYFESRIEEQMGGAPEIVVGLNCNICLLKGETLRRMYVKLMEDELADVIFPVTEIEPHLYMENPATGYLFPIWDDPGLDRQKFPRLFRRVGVTISHRLRAKQSPFNHRLHHEIAHEEALDIHSEDDLLVAEAFLRRRSQAAAAAASTGTN